MADLMFRPHTWDENIWKSVVDHNEYELTKRFSTEDVILDIGAHIGSFAYAILDRGAGKVFCIEPDPDNFLYLRHNLHFACQAMNRSVCIAAACWRSDGFFPLVHYGAVGANTGGGTTLGSDGVATAALSLDALATLAVSSSANGRIRLVKLDCEASEWPILYTAHVYDFVDAFVGEYHCVDRERFPLLEETWNCTPEGLERFFRNLGYEFSSTDTGNSMGKFRAWLPGREV